jgi:hypothetical protein
MAEMIRYSRLEVKLIVAPQVAWAPVQMIAGICEGNDVLGVYANDLRLPPDEVVNDYFGNSSDLYLTWREGQLRVLLVEEERADQPGTGPDGLAELCRLPRNKRVWIRADGRVPISHVLDAVRLLREKFDVRLTRNDFWQIGARDPAAPEKTSGEGGAGEGTAAPGKGQP